MMRARYRSVIISGCRDPEIDMIGLAKCGANVAIDIPRRLCVASAAKKHGRIVLLLSFGALIATFPSYMNIRLVRFNVRCAAHQRTISAQIYALSFLKSACFMK